MGEVTGMWWLWCLFVYGCWVVVRCWLVVDKASGVAGSCGLGRMTVGYVAASVQIGFGNCWLLVFDRDWEGMDGTNWLGSGLWSPMLALFPPS